MTVESLNKRLTRLGDSASPLASLADSLDMARARYKAREDEWRVAGKTGRMPPEPLEPPPAKTARRLDRETWRKLAESHARVVFLLDGKGSWRPSVPLGTKSIQDSLNTLDNVSNPISLDALLRALRRPGLF
jgi:hypothetical protein